MFSLIKKFTLVSLVIIVSACSGSSDSTGKAKLQNPYPTVEKDKSSDQSSNEDQEKKPSEDQTTAPPQIPNTQQEDPTKPNPDQTQPPSTSNSGSDDTSHKTTEPDTSDMKAFEVKYITVLDAYTANLVNQTSNTPQVDDKIMLNGQPIAQTKVSSDLFTNCMCFLSINRSIKTYDQFRVTKSSLKYQKYVFILRVNAENMKGETFYLTCLSYKSITSEMVNTSLGKVLKLE